MAIVVMAVLAASLISFVAFYQLATPQHALVRRDRSHPRPVMLAGGAFGARGRFDRLSMLERDVVLDQSKLVVSLRPRADSTSVLSIVEQFGCDAANDPVKLAAVLDGVDSSVDGDALPRVQAWIDQRTPGFEAVAVTRKP
jgi:hypothetical protein